MSRFEPAPSKPDSRVFASYPMPAKIDLINERPRRESLVEQQLQHRIGMPAPILRVEVTQQDSYIPNQQQQVYQNQSSNLNQGASSSGMMAQQVNGGLQSSRQQQQMVNQSQYISSTSQPIQQRTVTTTTVSTTLNNNQQNMKANNAAILAAELAEKEAKLMAEINALHARPYSPFQMPNKIDLAEEQLQIQQQQPQQQRIKITQLSNSPSPRPYSRASSTSAADLMEKEAKLRQEIEEMEKKPYNPQRMMVEREQWFEYPEGRPYDQHLTDSKRRVKDFCSLPPHMYPPEDTHTREENISPALLGRPNSANSGTIHTTIIRNPKREIDNKSPLPFSFDNFSTKGVRGNIASAAAVEPEKPRPPIYPIIKKSPSPNMARV